MDGPSRDIALSSCPSWMYFNAGGTGYYRVTWNNEKQLAALPLNQLTAPERLTLVYDLRARKTARGIITKVNRDKGDVPGNVEIGGAALLALSQ